MVFPHRFRRLFWSLAATLVVSGFAHAQTPLDAAPELWREPTVLSPRDPLVWDNGISNPNEAINRNTRFGLFRMFPGFPTDPVGLGTDDDLSPNHLDSVLSSNGEMDTQDGGRLEVDIGMDNPFFDFRSPVDPGGFGYYKLHSQYQLLDNGSTSLCLGLQAVTPAGLEGDGIPQGPTILSPALAWYQDLGFGTALQGFVSKDVRANSRWIDHMEQSYQYGLAVQGPLTAQTYSPVGSVHLFMEAIGRFQTETYISRRLVPNWEMLPGLHWQLGSNWWMTGGVLVPLGPPRYENGLWQITCSWRF